MGCRKSTPRISAPSACPSLRMRRLASTAVPGAASIGSIRAAESVVAALAVVVVLGGIAVDQGSVVRGMPEAAHFVLYGKQHFAAVGIHDVTDAVLMRVAFLDHQVAFVQKAVRPGMI